MKSICDWLIGKRAMPEAATEVEETPEETISFSIRDKTSVTINGLEMDLVEYVDKLARAEGDPLSVFMRKRLLEGLGSYLAGKNRHAWKAYKLIGEARENF